VVVERREQCDPETAISHGIEQSVAGGRKEKIQPQPESVRSSCFVPESQHNNESKRPEEA
jgi:hypothetical protein